MQRPIFVAIGGDSGSGKSTLTAGFYRIFAEDRITSLCLDDYHSLDRRKRQLLGITALNPRANNFALMENQLLALDVTKRCRRMRRLEANGRERPLRLRPLRLGLQGMQVGFSVSANGVVRMDRDHGGVRVAARDRERRQREGGRRASASGFDDEVILSQVGELSANVVHLGTLSDDVDLRGKLPDPVEGGLEQ